jgi:hypothetical protein
MSERRCQACEAPVELTDECYECLIAKHNARETSNIFRVTCKNGHPFTEENTRFILRKRKYYRKCRTCDREQYQKYYQTKGHLIRKERHDKSKQEQRRCI